MTQVHYLKIETDAGDFIELKFKEKDEPSMLLLNDLLCIIRKYNSCMNLEVIKAYTQTWDN